MRPGAPFLTLDDVTIRRGDRLVFPGTSWCMRCGERWAIVGPNGSGKSTLVRALTGALPVVKGDIVYHFAAARSAPRSRVASRLGS